jgi:hypothetical protein
MISSAALWAIWKVRNNICFQNSQWKDMREILGRIAALLQYWTILCPENKRESLVTFITDLRLHASMPERLR